ncbi:hypothetical protein EQG41_18375 [Billgrantia azerbaijanica]|nr:hypothetical protein EQG41_18375 [Halomonas azerbaijanica]
MALIDELRQQNPKLRNLSDRQIADSLRRHPDFQGMDANEFNAQVLGREPESAEPKSEDRSLFMRGLSAGMDQMQAMGGGLVALAGDVADKPGWQRTGQEIYDRNMAEAGESALEYGFTDLFTDPEASALDWAAYTAGNLLPMMATSIAGGGVGGVGARLLAGAAAKQAATRAGQAIGTYLASTGMEAGNLMGQTGEADVSLAHASIMGAADALVPVKVLRSLGRNELADKAAREISDGVLGDLRRQAQRGTLRTAAAGSTLNLLQEASTEGLQNLMEQHAVYWTETEGESLFQNPAAVDLKAMIDEAAAGGLMGGAVGPMAGIGERRQARQQVAQIEAARQQAAAQGGDALDQTMAAQSAEQQAEVERPAPEPRDPAISAAVGNRLQLAMGELDDLQNLARGSSYQGQTRLRNISTILDRAEKAFEEGNVEQAQRLTQRAEGIAANLRAALDQAGTRERPMEGELADPEAPRQPAGLIGQDGRRLPPGDPSTIYAEGPAVDQTQYDPQARSVRRDEAMAAQREGEQRMREQATAQRPQIADSGTIYGQGPVAGNANSGMEQQTPPPTQSSDAQRQAEWERRWRAQGVENPTSADPVTIDIQPGAPETNATERSGTTTRSAPAQEATSAQDASQPAALQYRANGSPFATEKSAMASGVARRAKAQGQPVQAVPVEGGFAVRVSDDAQGSPRPAMANEYDVPPIPPAPAEGVPVANPVAREADDEGAPASERRAAQLAQEMTPEEIRAEINEIGDRIKVRYDDAVAVSDPNAQLNMLDFATPEESERLALLKLAAPSQAQERAGARQRVQDRLQERQARRRTQQNRDETGAAPAEPRPQPVADQEPDTSPQAGGDRSADASATGGQQNLMAAQPQQGAANAAAERTEALADDQQGGDAATPQNADESPAESSEESPTKPKRRNKPLNYTGYSGEERQARSYQELGDYRIAKVHDSLYEVIDSDGQAVSQMAGPNGAAREARRLNEMPSDQRYAMTRSDARPVGRDDLAAALQGIDGLGDVQVVQSTSRLPAKVLDAMARQSVNGRDVRGVYVGDQMYVVADNVASIQEGIEVAVHEAVGHKGMRAVLGKQLEPVMLSLYRSLPNSQAGRQAMAEVRRDYPFLDPAKREDRITIAEEMVAHLLEKGHRPKAWQRAVAKIRELLRRAFPMVGWTYTDVLALGEQSRDYLRRQQAEREGEGGSRFSLSPGSDNTIELYHSGGDIRRIDDSGRFGSFLFFSSERQPHGEIDYRVEIDPDDIIDSESIFYQEGSGDLLDPLIKRVMEIAKVDEDAAIELIEQKTDPHELDHIAPEDAAELSFDIQRITAEAARELGFKGVAVPDEHGTSYMLDMAGKESEMVRVDQDARFALRSKQRVAFEEAFDDFTDADRAAAAKIGARTPPQRAMAWFKEKADRAGLKIRQGMVDRVAALKEIDEKLYGESALGENIQRSSWVLARMSNAANGALHALLHNGRIRLDAKEKVITLQDGDAKGLGEVLGRLGSAAEIERFMGWIAGNRAARLAQDGRENLFDVGDIDAMKDWNRGTMADGRSRPEVYREVFDEFQTYRDDVLAVAEQSGIISKGQREMWRDEFYVPFYRIAEDNAQPGMMATSGLSRQQAYKRLKGGTQNLNDLLQNTMMNFHHLLDASLKNQAAVQAVENAKQLGMVERVTESNRDTKKSTFVMEGGKKVFYEIDDPLVFQALTALAHPGMNSTAMKVMRGFKRVFTNLTTTTPQFMVANLIRDSLQATATNDVSKNAFKNVIDGAGAYRDQRIRAQMLASGASFNFGHLYGNNPDELRAQLTRSMRDAKLVDGPYAVPNVLRKGWAWWNDVNNAAENVNRAAIYSQNREGGELRAAFEARDLIDFSAHGAWPAVRILIDIVPFLNARIQGLDKIYRSGVKPGASVVAEAFGYGKAGVTDKQAAARFWTVTGALAAATIALYLHNQDDEEYQKLEDWQKDTYWFFRAGDNAFFIPKPFEVGAIATMAERITEQFVDDKATGKLFAQRLGHMMTDTFSFSPVPQAMQPALDIYANYDAFTGRPIESMGMERLSPELRRRASTSKAAEWISGALNNTVGAIGDPDKNPLALSPVQVDHLIGGYLGQVGTWVASSGDVAWNVATGKEEPASRWYEYQPVRRFYRNLGDEDRYTKYGTIFYEGLREASRAYADVKELREMGRLADAAARAESNREMLVLRLPLNRAQRRLNAINKQIDIIRRSSIDGEIKRQRIDRLRAVKNEIQRALGEKVREARTR